MLQSHTAIGVGDMELLRRDPTVPSLPRQLLSHVHAASALLSPKMKAFLSMLHDSLQEEGGKAKVVVFSQSAVVVNHTTQVLLERGIGAVKIGQPDLSALEPVPL
jgi:ERCC4-related helicase